MYIAISNPIEPRPGQQCAAALYAGWDGECVVLAEWTAANHAVNHRPGRAAVIGERNLAGAAFVRCTPVERDVIGLACSVRDHAWSIIVLVALAGKVASVCKERLVIL